MLRHKFKNFQAKSVRAHPTGQDQSRRDKINLETAVFLDMNRPNDWIETHCKAVGRHCQISTKFEWQNYGYHMIHFASSHEQFILEHLHLNHTLIAKFSPNVLVTECVHATHRLLYLFPSNTKTKRGDQRYVIQSCKKSVIVKCDVKKVWLDSRSQWEVDFLQLEGNYSSRDQCHNTIKIEFETPREIAQGKCHLWYTH